MPYGVIKVDQVTFTNAGVDQTISVSGIVASISGNITATGTISGDVIRGGTTVSGATVTGTAGRFGTVTGNTAGFTTVTGTTVTGTTASFTSGVFTSISGGTHTITSGVFASGTAAAPSITFAGDLDTGVYASAANQVAITTSGTERMRIDSTGKVGIGTSSPAISLDVTPSSANTVAARFGNIAERGLEISTFLTQSTSDAGVAFNARGAGNGAFAFQTDSTERLRLDSSGRLGVGTSSPANILHLRTSTACQTVFHTTPVYTPADYSSIGGGLSVSRPSDGTLNLHAIYAYDTAGGSLNNLAITSRDNIVLMANGAERLRLDSSGRLGIGTSSPGAQLMAYGANGCAISLNNASTGTTAASGFQLQTGAGGDAYIWNYSNSFIALGTNNTERVRLDSSGRLLVGTSSAFTSTNPTSLQVAGGGIGIGTYVGAISGTYTFEFLKSRSSTVGGTTIVAGGDNLGQISFNGTDGTQAVLAATIKAEVDGTPGANDMPGRLVFSTTADGASSPTERMRITSAGNVGIGTTSPGYPLDVVSNTSAWGLNIRGRSADNIGYIRLSPNDGATTYAAIGTPAANTLGFDVNGSERLRIDSSGRLLVGTSSTSSNTTVLFQGTSSNANDGAAIRLATGATTPADGANLGYIFFSDSTHNQSAVIQAQRDAGTWSGSSKPSRLLFSTTADGASSPTEHYRITNAGYLSFTSNVGLYNIRQTTYNTSSNAVLGVFGSSNSDGTNNGAVYNIEWRMTGNASGQFWYANYITTGGARTLGAYCTGTAWTNSSDIANKEEIVNTRYGLETVLSLRPVDFRWKSQRDKDGNGKPDIGFIAQEMEQIIPEVVTGAEGSKGISYGNLVSVLTKAIQEQQVMIAELQTKVAALEAA